jgi:hypothetical protein
MYEEEALAGGNWTDEVVRVGAGFTDRAALIPTSQRHCLVNWSA